MYKHLDSNQWIWEENNRRCRDLLLSKVYDFSVDVDTEALSKEAEGFLTRITLLFDPIRAAKAANALDIEARNSDMVVESTEGKSTKRRASTRKKISIVPYSASTPVAATDPKPTSRKPRQQRKPKFKVTSPNDDNQSPPPFSRSPPAKRIDAKSTPPKAESEEFKKMKQEMETLRFELVRTKLKLEEQLPSNIKGAWDKGEITKPTIDSALSTDAENLNNMKVTAKLSASENSNKQVTQGIVSAGSPSIPLASGDQLALQMMDFHFRESQSRQLRQIALRREAAMEEELMQERRDYHDLQMQLMRSYLGSRNK